HTARQRHADPRLAHARAQEVRTTRRPQTLSVLETLSEKQIARASLGLHNPRLVAFMNKTKVAIVGASGYSGEELLRLLFRHPTFQLSCFTSRQYAGQKVADVFPRFRGQIDATFVEPTNITGDVVFLALPHGVAAEFAPRLLKQGAKVLDLSADFRLKSAATYKEFYEHEHPAPALLQQSVYGLPELHRDEIRQASLIACPGCYPTSIILGIAPALKNGLAKSDGII